MPDNDTNGLPDWASPRRDVLKAVGAGSTLGVFGGTAAASGEDDSGSEADDGDETAEDSTDDDRENRVHVVEARIAPTSSAERPADFFYQPTGLHVQPGDVVKFVFVTPDHTVTTYHPMLGMQRRIPADADPIFTPVMGWQPDSLPEGVSMPPAEEGTASNGEEGTESSETEDGESVGPPEPSTFLHAFEVPGVYDIECAPHEAFGMAMRVVVGDETEAEFETSDASQLPPPRAGPVGAARQTLTDPAIEPDRIVGEGTVDWEDLEISALADGEEADGESPAGEGDDSSGNE